LRDSGLFCKGRESFCGSSKSSLHGRGLISEAIFGRSRGKINEGNFQREGRSKALLQNRKIPDADSQEGGDSLWYPTELHREDTRGKTLKSFLRRGREEMESGERKACTFLNFGKKQPLSGAIRVFGISEIEEDRGGGGEEGALSPYGRIVVPLLQLAT